jgi:hypothetical protein
MRSVLTAFVVLSIAAPAVAQQGRVDVDRLPINIERIQRELAAPAILEQRDGLNLRYYLNIYGQAPPLEVIPTDPAERLKYFEGPAPHMAPTHQDMLSLWTPLEFTAPVADLTWIGRWLASRRLKSDQSQ